MSCGPLKNSDEIDKSWLNEMLSQYYKSDCEIKSFEVDSAQDKEGYLSEICSMNVAYIVNGIAKDATFVFKFLPLVEEKKEFILNGKLAEREVTFYKFSLSNEFRKVVKNSGLTHIIPNVFYCEAGDDCLTIVMEDMKALHYKTIMLREGFDLDRILVAFTGIAIIHSAGLYHMQERANFGMIGYEDTTFFEQYLPSNIRRLSEIFAGEPISKTFMNLIPLTKQIRTLHLKIPLFETIIHGDFWAGQCMFREEKDICILDWQFASIGNPIVDLMGMFFMTCDPKVIESHLDEILEHYWEQLTHNLKINETSFSISYTNFLECVEKLWMTGFLFIASSLHDFLENDNISDRRLRGLMIFLNKRNAFDKFINEFK